MGDITTETTESGNIVYILVNEAMPGYVKIGRTEDLNKRMRQLYNTSIPVPFTCYFASRVDDAAFVEKQLHDAFGDRRVQKREFFTIQPHLVKAALGIARGIEIKIDEEEVIKGIASEEQGLSAAELNSALETTRTRADNFKFTMIGLSAGTELTHTHDATAKCTVYDERRVKFRDEIMSISKAAGIVLGELGYSSKVAGTIYWLYNDKNLHELRMDADQSE